MDASSASSGSTTNVDFVQEGRILKVQKNSPKLDRTVQKQFWRHQEWLNVNNNKGWHPYKKKGILAGLCTLGGLIGGATAPYVAPEDHPCQEHCPPLSASSPSSSPTSSPELPHKLPLVTVPIGAISFGAVKAGTIALFATAGIVGGIDLWTKIAESTQDYQDWEDKKTYEELRQFIADHYADHEELNDCMCPVTFNLMFIPLRLPCDNCIDEEALKSMEMNEEGKYPCPWENPPFHPDELQIGYERGINIAKCVRTVMRKDEAALKDSKYEPNDNPFPKIISLQNRFIDYLYRHAEGAFLPPGHGKSYSEQKQIRKELEERCGSPEEDAKPYVRKIPKQ